MKRARFSEEQIIGILKEAETAGNIRVVCREHNITEQTFYRWRNKYGGMDVSEARKLRELERENSELKQIASHNILDSARCNCNALKARDIPEPPHRPCGVCVLEAGSGALLLQRPRSRMS